jgi:hypothetical protein
MDIKQLLQKKKCEWVETLATKYGFSYQEALSYINDVDSKLITNKRIRVSDDSEINKCAVGIPTQDGVWKDVVCGKRVTRETSNCDEILLLLQM